MTAILGTTAANEPLELDLDRLVGSHACIVANSGGGKSGLVRKLLETTHGRIQHIVLDGEDEFYTLRERFSYVIAGGDGDCPATVANAESLALGALEHGFSLIAQLNDLGADGAPAFIGRFLRALVNAPRHLWHPVLVVIDEAQRFAPRVGATEATDGIKALLAQGRKRGFTAILAGTKLTEIDPAARGMCNNWLLGRVGQSLDRRTMAEELGFTAKEARERLQSIEPRQFWGFGPAIARDPVLFRVADVETTPIHAGQAKVPTPPAPEALRKILSGLAKVETATDAAPANAAAPAWPDQRKLVSLLEAEAVTAENRGYQRGLAAGVAIGIARCQTTINALRVPDIVESLDDQIPAPKAGETRPPSPAGTSKQESPSQTPPVKPRPAPASTGEAPQRTGGASLSGPQAQLMRAIAWWRANCHDAPTRAQVAAIAGWRITSGHLKNVAGACKTAGWVEYPSAGTLALTEAGIAIAPAPDMGLGFHDSLRGVLTGPQRLVLDHLLAKGPADTRDGICAALGWESTSGHIKNIVGSMKTLELVEYPKPGEVRLQQWVMG